jgi:predicted PurR-regulated permease PerM
VADAPEPFPERSMPRLGLAIARVGIVLGLMVATALVLRPFLAPMAWAAVVAYMTWGLYRRVSAQTGRPAITAALFALLVLLIFGLPAVWLLVLVAEQATRLAEAGQAWIASGAKLPEWLVGLPYVGQHIADLYSGALIDLSRVEPVLGQLGRFLSGLLLTAIGGALGNTVDFLFTVITLYVFYLDGERIVAQSRRILAHMFPDRPPQFLDEIGSMVRAVVIGVVGTAIVQGAVAGIGFALFGVPYAAALGALTIIASFLPMGVVVLWGPACIWLFAIGRTGAGIGLLLYSALVVSSIDNVARPILIKRSGSVEVPFLIVLFGALGGISVFGLLGLLLGPVILSVAFALLNEISDKPPHGIIDRA